MLNYKLSSIPDRSSSFEGGGRSGCRTERRSGEIRGQALIPLLIVILIVLGLGTAAIELAISQNLIDRYSCEGLIIFYETESALENSLLRLLRNPAYDGESLQIGESLCTITVNAGTPDIIVANCDNGSQVKKIQAEVNFVDGIMEVNHVREIE
ncbi:MAG: hypothetical protein JW991_00890 [Candidatus Pacebacteria bacterium]|nr:hypothetical protein [Candidatus Paceibacterota bacterium]